ncbi:hypothetical protein [Edaphobacter dinghuensis]|uniref:Uncharacterized protein n=1 Tax=Edaphobacter dinghuensis TaxID=1560005 RepID=A0A917HQA1_9BACT|nr:hypothetical protein [Edaphobacter dinghuensis]GGG86997.1 hypothetical protein GCM10011585_33740 [Edaphobacter dinghuensis]
MPAEGNQPQTFVEMVLALLEDRFPWLGKESTEPSGADTVQELTELHEELIQNRDQRNNRSLRDVHNL